MCTGEANISYEYFMQSSRNKDSEKRLVIRTEINRVGKIEANFVLYHNNRQVLMCKTKTYAQEQYDKLKI